MSFGGRQLREEEGGDEETQHIQLDDPSFTVLITSDNEKTRRHHPLLECRIELIIAGVFLLYFLPSVYLVGYRSGAYPDVHSARQFVCAVGKPLDRTGDRSDQGCRDIRVVFRVSGIGDADYVSRVLYQSMLKPPSRREERPIALPGESDAVQGPIQALVGTRG